MANRSDTGAGELNARVGQHIEAVRLAQHLSVKELSERSGLSRAILTTIERGDGNPSIGTLWKVAQGLRVPLGSLLDEAPGPRMRVVRAGEGAGMTDPSGLAGRLLHADGQERRTEVFELGLPAGAGHDSPGHLLGTEELVVVTAGSMAVGLADRTEELGTGDALWFAADRPHRYANQGSDTCAFLNWILYPAA